MNEKGYRLKYGDKWVQLVYQLGELIYYTYTDTSEHGTLDYETAKRNRGTIAKMMGLDESCIEIVEFDHVYKTPEELRFEERKKKRGKLKDYLD